MVRGQYNNPGEKVSRGVPAFLPSLPPKPKERDYNRLDLANWLVREDHPLTSRVIVNRIWQQFFGTGLVKTSSDFGTQGELPSHPELLDWLAVQFMEEGWDFRAFIKRILTSQTYQQSSKVSPSLLKKDPDNRLLARGSRYRLDAEIVRDHSLVGSLFPPAYFFMIAPACTVVPSVYVKLEHDCFRRVLRVKKAVHEESSVSWNDQFFCFC